MSQKHNMLSGRLYSARDAELREESARAKRLTRLFNQTKGTEPEKRREILEELLGAAGKNVYIEPPFRCDYGSQIRVGDNFYANYDCIMIDVCAVTIGNDVMFGPRVGIYTAAHPIDAGVRNAGLEYGKPVRIGDSVWIGGNAVINPGVTVGSNVVIGSGSVVTKDIPDHAVAAGNPCRVLREITDADKKYWEAKQKVYYRDLNQSHGI
ncbi:MAG: sugar O-acetyltransferase [Candidatus Marinimicrobia bacterium]|nr:sugar O-acetyltransferase [Candidatus Neomarinimicrobiota bacterium]